MAPFLTSQTRCWGFHRHLSILQTRKDKKDKVQFWLWIHSAAGFLPPLITGDM
jgi:hypothetical protein